MDWKTSVLSGAIFSNTPLELLHEIGLSSILGPLSVIFHHLGSTAFFMALVSFIYLCVDRKVGIRMAFGLMVAGVLNGTCKALLEFPRPTGLPFSNELGLSEPSFGFPSGHVQTAVVLYGTLFLHFKVGWLRGILPAFILLMPIARMYAGLHFLGDVIGGFILGLLLLIGLEFWFKRNPDLLEAKFSDGKELPPNRLKSYVILIIAMTIPSVLLMEGSRVDQSYHSWEVVVSSAGALAGFGIGIVSNRSTGIDWNAGDNWMSFLVRIGITLLGILVFFIFLGELLKVLLPENPVARYVRYGIVCYYISHVSPFLLKRIKGGIYLL
ncbi:phosphatase PAP2 family protein [Leptospira fainei]|nr:phosphatase PAP2 family protein [Leptospira fainei]